MRAQDYSSVKRMRHKKHVILGCLRQPGFEVSIVVQESEGLLDEPPDEIALGVSQAMREALGIRASNLAVDELYVNETNGEVGLRSHRMRGHFALRFGDQRSDDGTEVTRTSQMREAFNSPFRPFVLATTSVGQDSRLAQDLRINLEPPQHQVEEVT
jgi:hypothetical protein